MTLTVQHFGNWKVKQWECCGLLWQLVVTPQFKSRDKWEPVCPACRANEPKAVQEPEQISLF